jgi:DNA-binding transcriptional LysR family regulator
MKIQSVYIFIKLVELDLDFKQAQKILSLPRTTLWNNIADLEKSLKKTLINRKRQSLSLTTDGEDFIPNAYKLYQIYEDSLLGASRGNSDEIEGDLLISTTKAIALQWSMDSIKDLYKKFPNLVLKIIASDTISREEEKVYDILIRPFGNSEEYQKLWYTSYHHGLFASEEYLKKMSVPQTPQDLINHKIIGYGDYKYSYFDEIDWHLKGKDYGLPNLKPNLFINLTRSVFEAAEKGMGICSTPIESNKLYKGNLVRVLPEINGPEVRSYFCIKNSATRRKLKNINVFNDYFKKHLNNRGIEIHPV